jgi:hypothetical protein
MQKSILKNLVVLSLLVPQLHSSVFSHGENIAVHKIIVFLKEV